MEKKTSIVKLIGGIVLMVFIFFYILFPYVTADTTAITVINKKRIGKSKSAKYLVFTESEVFENTNCLVRKKFNSSDIQDNLKKGETYKVWVYGWRVPIFQCTEILLISRPDNFIFIMNEISY